LFYVSHLDKQAWETEFGSLLFRFPHSSKLAIIPGKAEKKWAFLVILGREQGKIAWHSRSLATPAPGKGGNKLW
jgi:hypothetical protein